MVDRTGQTQHHFISNTSTLHHIHFVLCSSRFFILLSTHTITIISAISNILYIAHTYCTVLYVQGDKPFKAYQQVIEERPLAAVQIILAIFAVEALGQFNQVT